MRLATQQGQDILDKAISEANAYRTSAAQYMDDMLAQLEQSTVSARNNLTSIFSGFHSEMSDYIDTVRQNRSELLPAEEESDDLMQEVGEEPEENGTEEDSEFVNTDMVQE